MHRIRKVLGRDKRRKSDLQTSEVGESAPLPKIQTAVDRQAAQDYSDAVHRQKSRQKAVEIVSACLGVYNKLLEQDLHDCDKKFKGEEKPEAKAVRKLLRAVQEEKLIVLAALSSRSDSSIENLWDALYELEAGIDETKRAYVAAKAVRVAREMRQLNDKLQETKPVEAHKLVHWKTLNSKFDSMWKKFESCGLPFPELELQQLYKNLRSELDRGFKDNPQTQHLGGNDSDSNYDCQDATDAMLIKHTRSVKKAYREGGPGSPNFEGEELNQFLKIDRRYSTNMGLDCLMTNVRTCSIHKVCQNLVQICVGSEFLR